MGGQVVNGVYLNTDSGLTAPGGFFDRLTNTVDQVAQNEGQLRGFAPALAATGIPISAPGPGLFSRILGSATGAQPPAGASMSPPASPQMPLASASGNVAGAGPSPANPSAILQYVAQSAARHGIDPGVATRVAMSEGGRSGGYGPGGTGDSGSSFSPFQLHYGGVAGGGNSAPGLGDDFTRQTGLDARDPANVTAAVDFALAHAAKNGWGAFHGAANAGIGAFDGIGQAGGAPPSASAYAGAQPARAPAPAVGAIASATGGDPSAAQRPTVGASGKPPMPQASADQADPNGPGQSPQGAPTADQVQALLANPATRAQGMQLWQRMRAQASSIGPAPQAVGGMPQPVGAGPQPAAGAAPMTLPGGLTPAALKAMIEEPATRAQGLALWQQALQPPTPTFGKPGDVAFVRGQPAYQVPFAPMDVPDGHAILSPNDGHVIGAVAPRPVPLPQGDVLQPTTGGPPIAANPKTEVVNGRVVSTNTATGASKDVTPPGVPSNSGLKAEEGANTDILGKVSASQTQALAAARTLDAIQRQQSALDKGSFTGGGADAKLKLRGAIAGMLGIDDPGVEHTQEFIAAANSKAAEIAKQLSQSGHTTNADLNMAKIIGGADINYSMGALREVGRAQQQLATDTIAHHNSSVDAAGRLIPALADRASFYKVPAPKGYDFDAAGALTRARAAIAGGADRGKVVDLLKSAGIDPARL